MYFAPAIVALTSLLPMTIASPSPSLFSRGLSCIDGDNNPAPCTCSCSRPNYLTNVNPPYSEGQGVNCANPDPYVLEPVPVGQNEEVVYEPPYGPVGCLSCQPFTGSDCEGAIPCDAHGECQYNFNPTGSPEGCYCWTCSTECSVRGILNESSIFDPKE